MRVQKLKTFDFNHPHSQLSPSSCGAISKALITAVHKGSVQATAFDCLLVAAGRARQEQLSSSAASGV
jgi:hypothetical protein